MKIEESARKESQVTRKEEIFLFNGRTKHGTLPTEFRIGIISLRSVTAGRLSSTADEPVKMKTSSP